MTETKTCTACGENKSLTDYRMYRHKGKLRPPGKCRPCQLSYRREVERESNIKAKRKLAGLTGSGEPNLAATVSRRLAT